MTTGGFWANGCLMGHALMQHVNWWEPGSVTFEIARALNLGNDWVKEEDILSVAQQEEMEQQMVAMW